MTVPIAPARSAGLAFLAGHCEERSRFLLYVLTAAVGAANTLFIVFVQGEDSLKRLVAVVTDVVVYGHGEHLACGLSQNCTAIQRSWLTRISQHFGAVMMDSR